MNQERQRQLLRIGIDGEWEAGELATSLSVLDWLYTVGFVLALEAEEVAELSDSYVVDAPRPAFSHSPRSLRRWARLTSPSLLRLERAPLPGQPTVAPSELLEPEERLVVKRVLYGSPGIQDLAGVGEIVGHVKDLLVRLIEHWLARRQRLLENERRELENQQLQVEIAKQFVGLAQEIGYTKKEMRQLVASVVRAQRPLARLIAAGKITSADMINNEPESS